jgi:hypothetical protein
MTLLARIGTALCLLLAASCGDSSDTINEEREPIKEVRESIRDFRYCEITPLFFGPDGISSDTWNTSGLNDCPAADWEALDFEEIRQELGALVVRENGPRHWLFDAGELSGSEEAERRFFGNLEFKLVAHVQFNFTPPPPGTFIFEVAVQRDTSFLFYKDRPVYELLAPLGKRYVMQSYALIADPTLTLADLDAIGLRLGLPEGWEYRVRVLSEDLLVEDFQGFATAVRDALENTYQRAETLEYLPAGRVAVEIFNGSTMQSWTAFMSEQEADELQVNLPWQKSDQIILADKSVYSRSPDAEVDGRFAQMTIAGLTFSYSGLALCEPELHSSGLVITGESRKFHELTYSTGRTIPYISNPGGENFVLVSNAPDALSEPSMLPAGWSHGEVPLSDDWRIVFDGTVSAVSTVETVDGTRIYQGPVLLPGMEAVLPSEDVGSSFTLKLLKNTGESPFANLAYECDECSFEQHAAIVPPPGWSKAPRQVILPPGELRSTPCFEGVPSTVDFVPEIPGNEFKLIAKGLTGRILEAGENGLMILSDIMRDTIFRFPLGSRIHELTDPEGNVFVLFGYEVESMDFTSPDFEDADALVDYPRPAGWTYSTRILDKDLVMESSGVVSILSIRAEAAASTWEQYPTPSWL